MSVTHAYILQQILGIDTIETGRRLATGTAKGWESPGYCRSKMICGVQRSYRIFYPAKWDNAHTQKKHFHFLQGNGFPLWTLLPIKVLELLVWNLRITSCTSVKATSEIALICLSALLSTASEKKEARTGLAYSSQPQCLEKKIQQWLINEMNRPH